jgi:hypothetical protein
MAGGDLPGDGSSEGIADESHSRNVELVKKAHNQVGHLRPTIALLRIGTGQSLTGQIQPDHPEILGQALGPCVPYEEVGGEAMQKHDRLALALVSIMKSNAADFDEARRAIGIFALEGGG